MIQNFDVPSVQGGTPGWQLWSFYTRPSELMLKSFLLLDIFLKSFPVQPQGLKDKLFIISEEDGGLSDEHITSLRRYRNRPGI